MEVTVNLKELTQYDVDVKIMKDIDEQIKQKVRYAIKKNVQRIVLEETESEIETLVRIDLHDKVRKVVSNPETQEILSQLLKSLIIATSVMKLEMELRELTKSIKAKMVSDSTI